MAEPTVQVPVSLIERNMAAARGKDWVRKWNVANELHALISQPTPTAEAMLLPGRCPSTSEHEPHCWVRDHGGPEQRDMRCPGIPAAPPSIDDMAPGTTFIASFVHGGDRELFMRTIYTLTRWDGGTFEWIAIDPSTIRDVRIPKEQP